MAHGPLHEEPHTPVNVWEHLTPENQRRLAAILREQIPELFRLNRAIEQQTGYSSEIGKNMLVDVLSHLGTLAQGTNLTPEKEASQLAKIEEHTRRAIIEHPEEVVRNRIVDTSELWSTYHRDAFPYRASNELHGVPLHKELEELRTRMDRLLESARSAKPKEMTWDESLDAAAEMTEAARLARDLTDKLEQCIGVAQRLTDEKRRDAEIRRQNNKRDRQWRISLVVAACLTLGGTFGGYLLGTKHGSSGASGKTPTSRVVHGHKQQNGPRRRAKTP